MSAKLRRWFIESAVAGSDIPELLKTQDKLFRLIDERVLRKEWFQDNVDYYYLRRNNQDEIAIWFQYIQAQGDAQDIEERVTDTLQEFADLANSVERKEVLRGGGTSYSRSEEEEREFQEFLRATTHVVIDLLKEDAASHRRAVLRARLNSCRGSPQAFWRAVAHVVCRCSTFSRMSDRERQAYRERFCRVVNGQHWAHFLCNMLFLCDPHPAYCQFCIPEGQWMELLGLEVRDIT